VKSWRRARHKSARGETTVGNTEIKSSVRALREFAYLDEVSVQSLLVSLIGELPAEVTAMSERSTESELAATAGAAAPLVGKAELTARYQGGTSDSSQVLSRAVAESLFKNLHELTRERVVWSKDDPMKEPRNLDRGSLIEIEVDLAPDPIYSFHATMGFMSDLAEDYPAMLNDPTTAVVMSEAELVTNALERMLAGLIPLRSDAFGLVAAEIDGELVAGTAPYFAAKGIESQALRVVGVTEQSKYWGDVRRLLFSRSRFTLLGRISRSGVQRTWVPVKLTEIMSEIAPQFPEAITRVGRVGYSPPTNTREEANRDALQRALLIYAATAVPEGALTEKQPELEMLITSLRGLAKSLDSQRVAFDRVDDWLIANNILSDPRPDKRELRVDARNKGGLKADSSAQTISDFVTLDESGPPEREALLDLEVIAIYW
jgi:hypothetical protein